MGNNITQNIKTLARGVFDFLKGNWYIKGSIITNNNTDSLLLIQGNAEIKDTNNNNTLNYIEESIITRYFESACNSKIKQSFVYSTSTDTLSRQTANNAKFDLVFVLDQGRIEASAQINSRSQVEKVLYSFEDRNNFSMLEEITDGTVFFSTLLHYSRILNEDFIDLSGHDSDDNSIE